MRTFLSVLAALGVARLVRVKLEHDAAVRAIRHAGAWSQFEIGAACDAQRVMHGDLSIDDYLERCDNRERRLHEGMR